MEVLWFVFGALATWTVIAVAVAIDDYQTLKDNVRNDHDEIKKQGESIAHFDGMVQDILMEWYKIQDSDRGEEA